MNIKNMVNIPILILSSILAIIGFILLGVGPVDSLASWKIAPVILVITYVVLFPLAVILKK